MMEHEREGPPTFPLGAVPVSLLTAILSLTSAPDVARLAVVNRTFAEAANSDCVWKKFLPSGVDEIVQNAEEGRLTYGSLKELYERLLNYVLLRGGIEGYWIDRKTGGVCRSYSAMAMHIWRDVEDCWRFLPQEGSRFEMVAYLRNVSLVGISGTFKCRLPPGTYIFSWILKFDDEASEWPDCPLRVGVTDGIMSSEFYANFPLSVESPCGETNYGWLEYDVGQFVVEKGSDPNAAIVGEVKLSFHITDTRVMWFKQGLYVDGVVVQQVL